VTYAQALRSQGRTSRRSTCCSAPRSATRSIPGLYSGQAQIYADSEQHDQALQALGTAVQQGEKADTVALNAVQIGQRLQRKFSRQQAGGRRRGGAAATWSSRGAPAPPPRGSSCSARPR
jgi:hypothetical protein